MKEDELEFAWLPEGAPPTGLINPAKASVCVQNTSCWLEAQFSIFFDGTRNHKDEDKPSGSHSNVARLYDICEEEKLLGQFRLYVQGVGTPFPEGDEPKPHKTGAQSGTYGDRRMRYAFLFMANELARLLSGKVIVDESLPTIIQAVKDPKQVNVWRRKLEAVLANPKAAAPKIPMITLDLFGFSRGAAAARAFLNHLIEWGGAGESKKPQFCGIPLRVRFMGLFDTVASVEIADSMPFPGDGHMSWAKPKYMIIPGFVEQCVHMVAGHEARNSFPLTTISASRGQAPQRLEIVYPGVHADVGGGYGPTAQGKGTHLGGNNIRQKQGDLLSQISLNDMYKRARNAAVPLSREGKPGAEFFAISPELQDSFNSYQKTQKEYSTGAPLLHLFHSHYLDYLSWRHKVLPGTIFTTQPYMKHCEQTQKQDFINMDEANKEFGAYLQNFSQPDSRRKFVQMVSSGTTSNFLTRLKQSMDMHDLYWGKVPTPNVASTKLFEQYVHDSRAGFVLTDPQSEREYIDIHADLERRDAEYQKVLRHHQQKYQKELDAYNNFSPTQWLQPPPPKPTPVNAIDRLDTKEREALTNFRTGKAPTLSDKHPASNLDDTFDPKDAIAWFSRREIRWSYLRRRQIFRAYTYRATIATGVAIHSPTTAEISKRLPYKDGLY